MLSRRSALALMSTSMVVPSAALARSAKEVMWDDLIPPGVPYAEIIGQGEVDEVNDTWNPVFDENAKKFNKTLDGAYIKMPGYILPFEMTAQGVTEFMLVPYVGACIHVPPPPPNQLVYVRAETPWPTDNMWDPVWVTGTMKLELQQTAVASVGYALSSERIEAFEW